MNLSNFCIIKCEILEMMDHVTSKTCPNSQLEKIPIEAKPYSKINLVNWNLVDHDMLTVANQAIVDKQCIELDLSSNCITSHDISTISTALSNTMTISRLYLSDNQIKDEVV